MTLTSYTLYIKKQLVTGALNGKLHSVRRGKLFEVDMGMLVKANKFNRRKILLLQEKYRRSFAVYSFSRENITLTIKSSPHNYIVVMQIIRKQIGFNDFFRNMTEALALSWAML